MEVYPEKMDGTPHIMRYAHSTGVVKPVYEIPTFTLTTKAV